MVDLIQHKRRFAFDTRVHQQALAMPGAQHISIDAHVSPEEALAIKRTLPRRLEPDEKDGLHSVSLRDPRNHRIVIHL
jgi:hypothetical protein